LLFIKSKRKNQATSVVAAAVKDAHHQLHVIPKEAKENINGIRKKQ
jgi:hypothetical protein